MLKITRITRFSNSIYFRTESAGEKHQWCLEWRAVLREFPPYAKWIAPPHCEDVDGTLLAQPTWKLPLADLEPHITAEDRAALLAISMRLARSGAD